MHTHAYNDIHVPHTCPSVQSLCLFFFIIRTNCFCLILCFGTHLFSIQFRFARVCVCVCVTSELNQKMCEYAIYIDVSVSFLIIVVVFISKRMKGKYNTPFAHIFPITSRNDCVHGHRILLCYSTLFDACFDMS